MVSNPDVVRGSEGTTIVQGYLQGEAQGALRVRLVPAQNLYQLTVKGPREGASRTELEVETSSEFAEAVLTLCGRRVLEKTRYPMLGPDGKLWVIDVFHRDNRGLALAELELSNPAETFELPDWCGEDVTSDDRYYNDSLSMRPFQTWSD